VITKLLKLLVTLALVGIVAGNINFQSAVARLGNADFTMMFVVVAVLALVPVLHALRWWMLLRVSGHTLSFFGALRAVMIGYFFNQTLPTSVGGDAYRVWYAYRVGMHLGEAFSSVIIDRLIALAALLVICVLGMPWIFNLIGGGRASWAVVTLVVAGVAGLGFVVLLERLPVRWNHWRMVRGLVRLGSQLRNVFANFRIAVATIAISALGHLIAAMLVALIGFAVRIPLSLTDCLLLVPLVMLIAMVPISIAGWGVREGAMVVAFGFVGIAPSDAFLLSLLFGLTLLVASLPGGLLWLADRKHSKGLCRRIDELPPVNQG